MDLFAKLNNWLLKRLSAKDSESLSAKNIYILPTREGVMFAILIIILLAAAINFNNSLVFFFTFLLAAIALISMWMTQKNLLGLEFSMAHVKPVFCCQNLGFPLIIKQSTHQSTTHDLKTCTICNFSIAIQFAHNENSLSSDTPLMELVDVHYDEKTLLQLSASSNQRGQFVLPPLTISSCYPLGLFRAWANIELNTDAIVYPRPTKPFSHKALNGANSEGQGAKGRGFDDFSGFKSYQPGESLNHIHWKAYAREQGLLSKTFSGANNHEYWLNWNELKGDTENRLSQLCRLIIDAEEQGDRYGLTLPGVTINIGQGQLQQHQCLKALALYPTH